MPVGLMGIKHVCEGVSYLRGLLLVMLQIEFLYKEPGLANGILM